MSDLDFAIKSKGAKIISEIPHDELRELLARTRFSCESRWMMAMVAAAGWDMANQMNLAVGEAVAEGEMHRLMELISIKSPTNDAEFAELISVAMELFAPEKYFDYRFEQLESGGMMGVVYNCFAYRKVKSIGVENSYKCGCFGMRAGWYKAMGIEVKERVLKCLFDGDDYCEITLEPQGYP